MIVFNYDKIWNIKNILFGSYVNKLIMVDFDKLKSWKCFFNFRYDWFNEMIVFVLISSKEENIFIFFNISC